MGTTRKFETLAEAVTALRRGGKQGRIAAIYALGKLDDPKGIPALVAVLDDPDPDLRALAMGKLVFFNDRSLVPRLVQALGDREPRVRQHALYALQRLKAASAADQIARVLGRDKDETTRYNAVLALAAVGTRKQVPAFVQALDDPSIKIMVAALQALARLAPGQVARHVVRIVREERRWAKVPQASRDVVIHLLKDSLKDKAALSLLRKIVAEGLALARKEKRPPMAMDLFEAAQLLGFAGDRLGVPVLLVALKGADYSQEKSLAVLAALKETSAVPRILETAFQNGFYMIKLKAIRALGEIGDVRALPALATIFTDRTDDFPAEKSVIFAKDDPVLRSTALAAMAKIAQANLRASARADDPFPAKTARRLLDEVRNAK